MKKEDLVREPQVLPSDILKPGQLIQVQSEVGGGGDKVDVLLEQIAFVEVTYSGENESYERFVFYHVFYHTISGKTLGYDLNVKNWWRVYKNLSGPNTTSPVHVFSI
jgi:hypothetical protein